MKQVRVIISGQVQGVGFRWYLQSCARRLKLTGWAKNTVDGKVEAVFQGDDQKIKRMFELCKKGPGLAQVNDVQTKIEAFKEEFSDFVIL